MSRKTTRSVKVATAICIFVLAYAVTRNFLPRQARNEPAASRAAAARETIAQREAAPSASHTNPAAIPPAAAPIGTETRHGETASPYPDPLGDSFEPPYREPFAEDGPRQEPGRPPAVFPIGSDTVRILGLAVTATPPPQFRIANYPAPEASLRPWPMLTVEFLSGPEWIDELTIEYWVLLGENRHVASRREVLRDVPRGPHRCAVLLHPNTRARFGAVDKAAVSISAAGRERAFATLAGDQDRSWLGPPAIDRLLALDDTPFGLVDYGEFEHGRPAGARMETGRWIRRPQR